MKALLFLLFLSSCALAESAAPAIHASAPLPPKGMWRCVLPGGTYQVGLRAIISVSSHEYIVDAAARVTEVNVDTGGPVEVRFYYIEPLLPTPPTGAGAAAMEKARSLVTEAAGRTGIADNLTEVWKKVTKSYPATTHAHTVEYRLSSKEQLQALYSSVEGAWFSGNSATFQGQ